LNTIKNTRSNFQLLNFLRYQDLNVLHRIPSSKLKSKQFGKNCISLIGKPTQADLSSPGKFLIACTKPSPGIWNQTQWLTNLGNCSKLTTNSLKLTWLQFYQNFCSDHNLVISTFKALNHLEDQILETNCLHNKCRVSSLTYQKWDMCPSFFRVISQKLKKVSFWPIITTHAGLQK